MAFRFGLESVLKHRKRLEDVAQREYMEAQRAVDECLQAMEQMYQRIDEVRAEIAEAQKTSSKDKIQHIRDMEFFIEGQKIRIQTLRQKARELLMVAEEKHEALVEAAKEKGVLVKLKEKRLAEYNEWLRKVEAKELDDQTMIRLNRGRK